MSILSLHDQKPKDIGNYIFLDKIGRGRASSVWKAMHSSSGFIVAIKIIPKEGISNERKFMMFKREIEIMKTLEHPFIVPLYEYLEDSENYYLVMEYMSNGSLYEYICENGALSESTATRFFAQIWSALFYLHSQKKVMHRDLKAENILIDQNFNIRIIDFGLSKDFLNEESQFHTLCGSQYYISPEIYKNEPYTIAADIWAFGVIVFYMSAGHLPFHENEIPKTMNKILFSPPPYPDSFSSHLKDVIGRMLVKSPDQRATLDDLKKHPYFSPRELSFINECTPKESEFAFHPSLIPKVEAFGISALFLRQSLMLRQFNEATALYRIIERNDLMSTMTQTLNHQRTRSGSMKKQTSISPETVAEEPASILTPPNQVQDSDTQLQKSCSHRRKTRERSCSTTIRLFYPSYDI